MNEKNVLIWNGRADGLIGGGIAYNVTGDHDAHITNLTNVVIMQNITGTLSPGGHPGSYNGQDAYNGMLVCGKRTTGSGEATECGGRTELYARSASNFEGGVE